MNENELILIISQPRSGSTLVQRCLATHPEISTSSESWWLLNTVGTFKDELVRYSFSERLSHLALSEMRERITEERFKDLTQKYILSVYDELKGSSAKYFLDKTPRYYEIIPEIRSFLPQSKMIILVRHPLDVLDSIIRTWVDSGQYLGGYFRDICIAPGLIRPWIHEKSIHLLRYEDVVSSPLAAFTELTQGIGISNNLDLKSPLQGIQGELGDDGPLASRSKIKNSSVGRWRARLEDKKWRPFFLGYASYLGPDLFADFGYEYPDEAIPTSEFNYFLEQGEQGLLETDLSELIKKKSRSVINRIRKAK